MTTPDLNFLSTIIPSYRRVQLSDFILLQIFAILWKIFWFCHKFPVFEILYTKKTGSFISYRRGDIVQSLTHIWTYLQMCTSTWKIAQNCDPKLSKATFATGCAAQRNLYRSRFCEQPCLCVGSSTRFGKQKLERTAGKIWYSNSVRPCTQNVHWDTA